MATSYIQIDQYEEVARKTVDPAAWCYVESGSGQEQTLRGNQVAFEHIWLRPRMLVPMQAPDLNTTVLGTPISMPIAAAPVGFQKLLHPEGEATSAKGVGDARTLYVASSSATTSLEDIAVAASGPLWFQLYLFEPRSLSEELVRRAEQASYQAIVVTVDTPFYGRKERFWRQGYSMPGHIRKANFEPGVDPMVSSTFDWGLFDWLRSLTDLPLVVKGILTAEDARRAVDCGVAGIVVSNHGGRQLDGALPSVMALPEVVEAVAGRAEVYLDGGIRSGTDAFKALALGARAVFVGRPMLWGLAVDGAQGVTQVFDILREELEYAMVLSGCPTVEHIDTSFVESATGIRGY
ncbi:alpha-hydroxy-acid oxidizing enzyme [Ktedonobacter sp. SOSP1-85]|uniref:alpha-hydroxy acid oxidase n=1 Tax=Ktedonobacter sp. SOSP1-85 TaxID=2778367 RepID=UPI001916AD6C|nr:alpha-hydroxy acid oxidase [Ktedonobacter sp. SOSP1-85]GHO80360.1 alpha-hydroxy-acid oxidizing enzyme [Ktedonobacter sp. SOSP1-85]